MMEGFALRLREESELEGVDRYRSRFLRMIYYTNRAKFTEIVDPQRIGMCLTRPLHSMVTRRARKYLRRHEPEDMWNVLMEIQYCLWYYRYIPIEPVPPTVDVDLLKLMREAISRPRLNYKRDDEGNWHIVEVSEEDLGDIPDLPVLEDLPEDNG